MDIHKQAKRLRRKLLVDKQAASFVELDYGKEDIFKMIPNRDPFFFLDKITGIDLENESITATRKVAEDDPVFQGHFPDMPVYPGALLLEMTAEVFNCLYYFVSKNTTEIIGDKPVRLLATRLFDGLLQKGIFPGDELEITGKVVENNGLTFTILGQILRQGEICLIVAGEYYIVDKE